MLLRVCVYVYISGFLMGCLWANSFTIIFCTHPLIECVSVYTKSVVFITNHIIVLYRPVGDAFQLIVVRISFNYIPIFNLPLYPFSNP